MAEIA
jgi:hypothetical protein